MWSPNGPQPYSGSRESEIRPSGRAAGSRGYDPHLMDVKVAGSSRPSIGPIVRPARRADDKEIVLQVVDGVEQHGVAVAANVVDQMIGTGGAPTGRLAGRAVGNAPGHRILHESRIPGPVRSHNERCAPRSLYRIGQLANFAIPAARQKHSRTRRDQCAVAENLTTRRAEGAGATRQDFSFTICSHCGRRGGYLRSGSRVWVIRGVRRPNCFHYGDLS